MIYQLLGKSNLQVSKIGFGCMSLKPGQPDNEAILLHAVEGGITYFDTADLYDKGANEELIGKTLKQFRNKIIIATKVGNQWRKDGSGWDWNPTKKYILTAVEESLRRLQTDYIDLYQLHGGTITDPMDETIEAFELLSSQGKIRYYGISSIRPNVIRYWSQHSNIISVMMQYSLLDRRPEEECFKILQQKNIGVLARGSVAQGLLIDKPAKPYLDYSSEQVAGAAKAIHQLSDKNRAASQTAIQFVLDHPAVVSAVAGIRTMSQLNEAIAALNVPVLSKQEMERLQSALPVNYYREHR